MQVSIIPTPPPHRPNPFSQRYVRSRKRFVNGSSLKRSLLSTVSFQTLLITSRSSLLSRFAQFFNKIAKDIPFVTCYVCAKASPVKLYTACSCFGPFAVGLFVRVSHFKVRQFRSQALCTQTLVIQ